MATNALKKSESFETGERAENIFERVAKKEHFKVYKANRDQNINQHIDFFISCYHFNFSVDVKARKKINRGDSEVNDEWTWIEFKNVRARPGWLYGKADYIAFEREFDLLIVNRYKLIEFCEDKIDLENIVPSTHMAEYAAYQRKGRKDLISRVCMDDINKLEGNIVLIK